MRRDSVAFITSAFGLGFRRSDFLELCTNTIETRTTKGRAACYHWLLASNAILKELLWRLMSSVWW